MFSDWFDLKTYFTDLATGLTVATVVGFVGRYWVKKQLAKWKRSADAWWLACDLHSIHLQATLNRFDKMRDAIDKAYGHARDMKMEDRILSDIQKLKDTYSATQALNDTEKKQIRAKAEAIIDYCGKLAELNQPGYKP